MRVLTATPASPGRDDGLHLPGLWRVGGVVPGMTVVQRRVKLREKAGERAPHIERQQSRRKSGQIIAPGAGGSRTWSVARRWQDAGYAVREEGMNRDGI